MIGKLICLARGTYIQRTDENPDRHDETMRAGQPSDRTRTSLVALVNGGRPAS